MQKKSTYLLIGAAIIVILIIALVMISKTSYKTSEGEDTRGTQTTATSTTAQAFTMADVGNHATASDCWTAINGKVYDISALVPRHPGGPVIIQACGKDGTTLFMSRNGNGAHPEQAQVKLETYYIGTLAAAATTSETNLGVNAEVKG
jgi:cytochrome b involved in lipid metabolism